MKSRFLFIVFAATWICSCSDDAADSEKGWREAQVETLAPVSVSLENAVLQGRSYQNGETIVSRGFLFSLAPMDPEQIAFDDLDPEQIDQIVVEGNGDGVFSTTLENLVIGTTCYYRAFIRLADGAWRVGEERHFNPDYLDVHTAVPPQAHAVVDSYKTATVELELGNFGTDDLQGLEPQMFHVYEVGVYYWQEGEAFQDAAVKMPCEMDDEERMSLSEGQSVRLSLTGLRGETTYHYMPYIQIGIYRPYAEYVYLMPEVLGETDGFTTEPTPAAGVETLAATEIATRGGILNGKLISDAGDENARFGFCVSADESDLEEHRYEVETTDDQGLFLYAIGNLDFNRTYYFKTYVSVREGEPDAEIVYGATMTFTTADLNIPVLEIAAMNYDYRLANVTPTSAVVTCRLVDGLDPSLDLASCKVNYGTDPEALDKECLTADTELVDGNAFTVNLIGLDPGTTYYFRPSASNEKGSSVDDQTYSFRTAVTTREYLFDPTITAQGDQVYVMRRMSTTLADCTDLVYHELDPIEGASVTYYLLDRNLNSRMPFEQADMGKDLKTTGTEELWKKAGGLYAWGFETPSYTWNIPGVTVLKDLPPYLWADPNPVKKNGTEWPVNPCPEGYDIPTKAQYEEMIRIASGGEVAAATLSTVFKVMRMGPTSGQKGNNGNTNEGVKVAMMHLKDGCASDTGQVGIVRIEPDKASIGNYSRTNSLAIRCVRVVAK